MFTSSFWHVGQLFDEFDDQVHVCNLLINDILDEVAPVKRMRVRDKLRTSIHDIGMEKSNQGET